MPSKPMDVGGNPNEEAKISARPVNRHGLPEEAIRTIMGPVKLKIKTGVFAMTVNGESASKTIFRKIAFGEEGSIFKGHIRDEKRAYPISACFKKVEASYL